MSHWFKAFWEALQEEALAPSRESGAKALPLSLGSTSGGTTSPGRAEGRSSHSPAPCPCVLVGTTYHDRDTAETDSSKQPPS